MTVPLKGERGKLSCVQRRLGPLVFILQDHRRANVARLSLECKLAPLEAAAAAASPLLVCPGSITGSLKAEAVVPLTSTIRYRTFVSGSLPTFVNRHHTDSPDSTRTVPVLNTTGPAAGPTSARIASSFSITGANGPLGGGWACTIASSAPAAVVINRTASASLLLNFAAGCCTRAPFRAGKARRVYRQSPSIGQSVRSCPASMIGRFQSMPPSWIGPPSPHKERATELVQRRKSRGNSGALVAAAHMLEGLETGARTAMDGPSEDGTPPVTRRGALGR